jgi:thiol-disulfide isomerase/thioredoxin
VRATAKAAVAYASRKSATALVSTKTAALLEKGIKAMMTMKLKVATVFTMLIGTLCAGASVVTAFVLGAPSQVTGKASKSDQLSVVGPKAERRLPITDGQQQPTPAEQFDSLVKDAERALEIYFAAVEKATDENRDKVRKDKALHFGPKFLALAEKYPKDLVSLEALLWVVTEYRGNVDGEEPVLARALDILLQNYLNSEELGRVCVQLGINLNVVRQHLTGQEDPTGFLLAVMEKSPHKHVQAEACLALAWRPVGYATTVRDVKENPDMAKGLAGMVGNEVVAALLQTDVEKLWADCEKYFNRFAENYSGVLSIKRVAHLCSTLSVYTHDKPCEAALRKVLVKDDRREVQGVGTLTLVRLLCDRAVALREKDAKAAEKLLAESERLLERASEKYADVPLENTNVAERAKRELFALRNLLPGKVALETEGLDQFGKRFNLRDYRGKVVLLDFWSEGCPGCIGLWPKERSLVKQLENKPFALIGVNCDGRTSEEFKKLMDAEKLSWRCFADPLGKDAKGLRGPITDRWDTVGFPTTYILDHKGVIRCRNHYLLDSRVFDELLSKLIKEAEDAGRKDAPPGDGQGERQLELDRLKGDLDDAAKKLERLFLKADAGGDKRLVMEGFRSYVEEMAECSVNVNAIAEADAADAAGKAASNQVSQMLVMLSSSATPGCAKRLRILAESCPPLAPRAVRVSGVWHKPPAP